jgi:GNAT superfamily N-acetyltransferase
MPSVAFIAMRLTHIDVTRVPEVCDIEKACFIENQADLSTGFLMNTHDATYFLEWSSRAAYFAGVEDRDKLIGFTLVVSTADLEPVQADWMDLFAGELPDYYVRHVGVRPEHRWSGLGHLLYEDMAAKLKGSIASMVIHEPYNAASVAFHERNGFVLTRDVANPVTAGWKPYGIYVRADPGSV